MSLVETLERLGGVATRATLLRFHPRTELERLLAAGDIVRVSRGRYAVAGPRDPALLAAQVGGKLCLTSAALHHGWPVKSTPDRPHVAIARGHRVASSSSRQVHLHRVHPAALRGPGSATDTETTLSMCLRSLAWDEALAVADSALRAGLPSSTLARIADEARGPGSPQMRRVAAEASELAANPFESVLRAIALDVPGLRVQPQVPLHEPQGRAQPDLVDRRLRLVLEADSFEWHGGRAALAADARRYNILVVNGWLVLRFCWEDVMFDQQLVRETLVAARDLAELLTEVRRPARRSA